jgi:hypothetical protein
MKKSMLPIDSKPNCKKVKDLVGNYALMSKDAPWIIGDLVLYMRKHPSEELCREVKAVLKETGYTKGSIENLVYVARNVPPERRNPNCRHAYHYAVAHLEPTKQIEWLALAEIEGWSVEEFRNITHGRPIRGVVVPPKKEKVDDVRVSIQTTRKKISNGSFDEQFELWWEGYARGKGFDATHKECARAGWNSDAEIEMGFK